MAVISTENHKRFIQYENSLKLALQQEEARLWPYGEMHNVEAESGLSFSDTPAHSSPNPITSKWETIGIQEVVYSNRWLTTTKVDDWRHWHTFDATKVLSDPRSSVYTNFRAAWNRHKDDVFIKALYSDVARGTERPGDDTAASFDSNQVVAVNVVNEGTPAATGLNRAKLNRVFTLFKSAEAPSGTSYMAVSAKQMENLLEDQTLNDRMALIGQFTSEGKLRYLDFEFIDSARLPTNGSGYRRCFAWKREGIRTAIAKEPVPSLDKLINTRGQPWQAYWWGELGAARTDEKLVVEVLCAES